MKRIVLLLVVLLTKFLICNAQSSIPKGTVEIDSIYSKHLENDFGENPKRAIAVYLPPGYHETKQKYPVVYFLHGFTNDHTIMNYMEELLDYAIASQRIRPFILVTSDQKTTYGGSFYSNSGVFGNWEDFTVQDLVGHIDKTYRTLPKKESRGITGHSMGGYGALLLAMKHPDVFSSVYAISPGALAIVREYGPNSETFKELSTAKTMEDLWKTYFGAVMVAFGRSWSPNPDKAPFYCDMPFEYQGDKLIVHQETLQKWYDNMPFYMIDTYLGNLQQLEAIKLDWGRNAGDRFTVQCEMFSQRLENVGITHFAEEYIGTHVSDIYTKQGRIPQQVLPFFDEYLKFE
ncbi:alpha/beta hydrolase family protein [Mangrovimonas sp. TPBH4]|uniref:alpha/beta hydrolase n=1 Tax=Mangrovimonas sp. TPBH4 TaxID=1645914 RepID=UPI0006B41713|nr:alpha/beta fold hydrolase [Mangrovimonas sp. TPBH4]